MTHLNARGRLKIYLGYAPGVGKTYQMLEDARDLKARGVDLVVGFVDPHGRADIRQQLDGLQAIPLVHMTHRVGSSEELDVDAILKWGPRACVVDELAHSNAPGSPRQKRWQDVQVLLQAGIDVLTTMDVEDLASLSDQIWQLTGRRVRENVPDWFFQQADEVVLVDVTPRALLHRLERGAIYPSRAAKSEVQAIFQEPVLVALRELAIRQTAQALEARQTGKTALSELPEQKIVVNITADPATAMLLRRARRMADHLQAVCMAVYVYSKEESEALPSEDHPTIARHLRFAENLHIPTKVIHGRNRAQALVDYARKNNATQIFLNRITSQRRRWLPGLDFTEQVLQLADEMEVTVVAERHRHGRAASPYPEDEAGALMHAGYVRISPDASVEEAIGEIRKQAGTVEMIYYAYALDDGQHLLGVVSFRELISAERSKKVHDVIHTDYVFVEEDTDQETVARLLAKRRLLAVPVLDSEGHMRGIVTSADVAGVVQEEAGEDILKIGGMEAFEGPYLDVTFGHMVRKRAGWLAILFVGEMLTATAMGFFSKEIERAVVLALFIPLIISSGGNSGSQATTLVIRAMALGEIKLRDWLRVIRRELAAGIALGAILGVIGVSRIMLWHALRGTYGEHYLVVALTIGCSLIGVVLFGTTAGSMLPFVLRRVGLDPASASAPFVATLVDVSGLVIYFSVASVILHGILL
ncbi:MAG TPA: magnesium transporter [Terriglobales bacterium]|nr:magnesium transporter [Terriglobales bacterium]